MVSAEYRHKESWMIPKSEDKENQRPGQPGLERSWSDLEQLARRVIRAANLAVMTHAELELFTKSASSASNSVKKAG
jgi:hypothetical protein